jgi:hypothetical protein
MKLALVLLMLLALTNVVQKPVPTNAVDRSRKGADVLESGHGQTGCAHSESPAV